MSTDEFINIAKSVTTVPTGFLQTNLLNAVKYADEGVRTTFFPAESPQPYIKYEKQVSDSILKELAVKYACFALSTDSFMGFNTTVQNADYSSIREWFMVNTNRIGQRLFIDYMQQPSLMGSYFVNPAQWAAKIASEIGNEKFLTGLLIECDTIGSMLPPKVVLLMLRELDNPGGLNDDGPNFNQVLKSWVTNSRWRNLEGYDTFPWLDTIEPSFRQGAAFYNIVNANVKQACSVQDPPKNYTTHEQTFVSGFISYEDYDIHSVTSGSKVAAWLDSGSGPKMYQLRSGQNPSNTVTTKTKENGCLIAGTPILMADGSLKPVEQLQEGDKVMNGKWETSVCSGELVMNDSVSTLYSINDDEPFMSLEHAVMTQRGWCSLAPAISMDLTPHHNVGRLTIGDVVWKAAKNSEGKWLYTNVPVKRINTKTLPVGQYAIGFDLHFHSGHPSYIANGYCNLLSYPEITAGRITANALSHLSQREQIEFEKKLHEMSPLLEKVMGKPIVTAVTKALKSPRAIASRSNHTDNAGIKKPYLRGAANMVLPKMKIETTAPKANLASDLSIISLVNGHVLINDVVAETHCHDNMVYWTRKLANGTRENGAMQLLSHGLMGNGVISYGNGNIPFTATPLFHYQISGTTDKSLAFNFELGFVLDQQKHRSAIGELYDPNNAKNDSNLKTYSTTIISQTTKVVNGNKLNFLHVSINFDPNYCSLGFSKWIAAEIDLNMDYSFCTGVVYNYDSSQRGGRGAVTNVSGGCIEPDEMAKMLAAVSASMAAAPVRTTNLEVVQPTNIIKDTLTASLLLAADPLKVEFLFDLPEPDMKAVHEDSFGKLKGIMLRALAKENKSWEPWFGETLPPVGPGESLSEADVALLNDASVSDFLINKFSIGYLTQAFSQSTEPIIKAKFDAMPDTASKLAYFWQGDSDSSFAKNKGYNIASTRLMDNTYAEHVPELKPYLENDPVGWAKQLYDYCTIGRVLNGLALQTTLDGQQRLNHLCMILHALDPIARIDTGSKTKPISYATSLHQRVMEVRLNEIIKNATIADQTDFVDFLTEYYKQYFDALLQGDGWADSIRAEAQQSLKDLMDEMNVTNVNDLVLAMGGFIADSVALIISVGEFKTIATKLQAWGNWVTTSEFGQKWPRLSKFIAKTPGFLGGAFTMGVYGFGIFQCVSAFMNWDQLTKEQKAVAITGILNITASIVKDATAWKAAKMITAAGGDPGELMNALNTFTKRLNLSGGDVLASNMNETAISLEPLLADAEAPAMQAAGDVLAKVAGSEAEAAARWVRVSSIADAFAKIVSIGALAAVCVASGFQIANDFATDQPISIKVLDIIGEISNVVALVADIISSIAVAVGSVLSVVPVVGLVAAAIGVIISFVSSFIHRKPPPTPQEVFIDEQSAPFIKSLPLPTKEWLDKQKSTGDQPEHNSMMALAFA